MKNIKLLYGIALFLVMPLCGIDNSIATTIFVPIPLIKPCCKKTWEQSYTHIIKKAAIPLACCFCYTINKNNIWTDIKENPYSAIILIYTASHYCINLALQDKDVQIDQKITNLMQDLFYLLIIGHGMYNKIISLPSYQDKILTTIDPFIPTDLELFLYKAYHIWSILFSYYQEHHTDKPLYAYDMNQIDLFEVAQACSYEPEILPSITHFYNKNNTIYNCESVLNFLENKLNLINHKLIPILPTQYQDDYGK